jgi:hypothetical protein
LSQGGRHVGLVHTADDGGGHSESIASSGHERTGVSGGAYGTQFADFNGADSTTFGVDCCFPGFCVADVNSVIARALYPPLLPVTWKFRLYLHPLGVPGTRVDFISVLEVCR